MYFGMSVDSERESDPATRLRNEVGADLTQLALEGSQAVLLRSDLPSPKHIAELAVKRPILHRGGMPYWRGWMKSGPKHGVSIHFQYAALKTALCLTFEFPTYECNGNTSPPNQPRMARLHPFRMSRTSQAGIP